MGLSAGLAWLDMNTDGTGTSLFALLLVSGVLGAAAPRQAVVVGLLTGSAIAVGHLAVIASGHSVPAGHPSSTPSASALFLLIAPALVAALVGARLRQRSKNADDGR